jgi:prepilin peptidase CpaA
MALVTGMPPATLLVTHLAAGACVLILTFIFFTRGWIGGGDAKLAAATAVWLGWDHLLEYGLQASIMGALLTIGIVYCRRFVLPDALAARDWIVRLHTRENGVPYGIALAIAGLVIYPETALWRTIIG